MKFVFLAHHKAGSSWLHRLFWNLFADSGILYRVYDRIGSKEKQEIELILKESSGEALAFGISNSRPVDLELFRDFVGVHVVRDPRDLIVSGYYSHRDSHPLFPGLAEERAKLLSLSRDEGLYILMEGLMSKTFESLYQWPRNEPKGLTRIRFEDLIADYQILKKALNEMGILGGKKTFLTWPRRLWNQAILRQGSRRWLWSERLASGSSFDHHLCRLKNSRRRRQRRGQEKGRGHHRPRNKETWGEVLSEGHHEALQRLYPGLNKKLGYDD